MLKKAGPMPRAMVCWFLLLVIRTLGDAVASASGSSINIGVAVSLTGGKPVLKTTACAVNLGNFDVTVHGGISWLVNIIEGNTILQFVTYIGLFKGTIKSAAQNAIQGSLQDQINNQANKAIQATSFVVPVKGANLEFDASVTVRDTMQLFTL